jgi:hypothetical protein
MRGISAEDETMKSDVLIRIFDTDASRLEDSEITLRRYLKAHGVKDVEIEPVSCFLEIQRQNKIKYIPAMEVNGLTISVNKVLTESMLEDCSIRLSRWQAEKAAEAREKEENTSDQVRAS